MKLHSARINHRWLHSGDVLQQKDYAGKTTYSSSSGDHFLYIDSAVVSSLCFPYIVADACCNASYETYLQLNALRSTSLQEVVLRADGNSLHNYAPMYRLSCAIHCYCFCGFNLTFVLFLILDQVYVDAVMSYPLFHFIYL